MSTGAYLPRWLNRRPSTGNVRALVFIMNRDNPAYTPALPEPELPGHRAPRRRPLRPL